MKGARDGRVSVVVATFNRRRELLHTLAQLSALPERPLVVVVDNGSSDGTPEAVRRDHPDVEHVAAPPASGPAGRNLGVARVDAPYVAFADDDSWWAPGALSAAADMFERHPQAGLLAAKVLVGPEQRTDAMSEVMARSPIPPHHHLPGVPVMGFLACAAVVRRGAFEDVGGFHSLAHFGGEETLLAVDLADAGWGLAYVEDLVAFHHPSSVRHAGRRRAAQLWNQLLRAWLRFPAPQAVEATRKVLASAAASRSWSVLSMVVRHGPAVLRQRTVVRATVMRDLALIGEVPASVGRAAGGP